MQNYTGLEVAIIGMAGKFPGAGNINEFWENIKSGVESVAFYSDEELLASGIDQQTLNNPSYVKANAFLNGKDFFDAEFFNYRPEEAKLMDPQMRLFHQCVWEALEDAGCNPRDSKNKIGLFAGSATNSNWVIYSELMNREGGVDDFTLSQLNNARYVASKVAYCLDFKGPAVLMDTACSSSLVSMQYACKSLLLGDCNIALAGGVSVNNKSAEGYWYADGMIHSQDGHCRTFDNEASGTVGGEGAAVVVLKLLKNAIKDKDHIWAIIKGGGINNDGHSKVSFTAPSVDGQTESVMMAQKWAKVEPESISYIETHGTATKLGDPIEVEALKRAFGKSDKKYCALGSVKANIGHLDSAAGGAGIIKAAMALKHKQVPPSINFKQLSSKINIDNTPFYINTELKNWEHGNYPLRAGVSSFGVGGTNAHLILEEAPNVAPSSASRAQQMLLFSAKDAWALQQNIDRFKSYLKSGNKTALQDIAYTLQTGRVAFPYRAGLICNADADVNTLFDQSEIKYNDLPVEDKSTPEVVFMFPGQGAQYVNMCAGLYHNEPLFKEKADQCLELIQKQSGKNLKEIWFSDSIDSETINATQFTQPLLFTVEYALASLLMNWGIYPDRMIGHSLGEYVAACISGVFSLEDAVMLVTKRAELMQEVAPGAMLGISIAEDVLRTLLADFPQLSIAAVNSTQQCVVAGEKNIIAAFKAFAEQQGYTTRHIHTSHAFHSAMMDVVLEKFKAELLKVSLNKPVIPFISNLTGKEASVEMATDVNYWVNHLRNTVKFADGVETSIKKENTLFIELGPGRTLSTNVRNNRKFGTGHQALQLVRGVKETADDLQYLLSGITQLWLKGIEPDWTAFYTNEERCKVSLPTYSFKNISYPAMVNVRNIMLSLLSGENAVSASAEISKWAENHNAPANNGDTFTTLTTSPEEQVSETELQLLKLWQAFFGKTAISINDNFFDIGGDSLKATTLIARINKANAVGLSIGDLFQNPTIKKLSDYIQIAKNNTIDLENTSIQPAVIKEYYPLSAAQKRLYFLHELDKGSLAYNMLTAFKLKGSLDKDRLINAVNKLVATYEVLRTTFAIINHDVVQKIAQHITLDIEQYSASSTALDAVVNKFMRPFDLQNGPLIRVGIIEAGTNEHVLVVDTHHIISDGISQGVFIKALTELYAGNQIDGPQLHYKDYAEWQQDQVNLLEQKSFWFNEFSGNYPVLELPIDNKRPNFKSYEGDTIAFDIPADEFAGLKEFAAKEGVTVYMFILAVYNILLSKLTNQDDIIIGTTVSGRQSAALENMMGMFVNTLPIRNYPTADIGFSAFLQQVKAKVLACFQNQSYQYEDLVDELRVKRTTDRNPLFDVLFTYQRLDEAKVEADGVIFEPYPSTHNLSQFDLTLWGLELNGQLTFRFEYCTALFKKESIQNFIGYFKSILSSVLAEPEGIVGNIAILQGEERIKVLDAFNQTKRDYKFGETIHGLFEKATADYPNQEAVNFEGGILSYQQLNEKANQIAHKLCASGAQPGDVVGLLLSRSHELIVALLGILKAGCAYLPIDPEYPAERIRYVVNNTELNYMLTQPELKGICYQLGSGVQVIDVTDKELNDEPVTNPSIIIPPHSLAYVIYTSGSTGLPKGVMVTHNNVVNFIYGIIEKIPFKPGDTILCLTTVSFDIFVLETLLPLATGLQIVMASADDQRDAMALECLIAGQKVNMLQMTPSHLRMLLSGGDGETVLKKVKAVMIGGEAFPADLLKELQGVYSGNIYNMYGPTETTVWSTVQNLTGAAIIDIGKPISNTVIRILNDNQQLQPIGIAGELYIGGDGVSKGYWNNEALTQERFIADPYTESAQLYRTGDIARWLPDGNIECLGRADNQVKLRGFRIELGEIESKLAQFEGIEEAVVLLKVSDGEGYLAGYYRAEETIDAAELREHLLDCLPYYMVPSIYMHLDTFPLTPNGKLDRKSFPDPESQLSEIDFKSPENQTQVTLTELWAEVLKLDAQAISINQNFFELGGHSLRAMVLINKLNQLFNIELPLRVLFDKQTIENLADYIIAAGLTDDNTVLNEQSIEITL
jgi:amino acid adenylation domain-containing protein